MTQHVFGAGLYAPLRVAIYEGNKGGTVFEYDRPSTQFAQFNDPRIDDVAKSLDQRLQAVIAKVCS